NADPVQKISIISRGMAGGYTLKVPLEDKHMHSRQEFLEELSVLLGGYIAEQEIFGDITTGATSDLRTATHLARRMITDYGMSRELGPRTFGNREELIFLGRELHEQRDYSEKIAERIDDEIMYYLNEAAERARQIIREQQPKLEKIVAVLLKQETLEKEEFDELMKD
ncbi:MAG: cell division protein FtsH, partial [Patescibacteria group bacterium]